MGKILCFHNRYNLGDENEYDKSQFGCWDELKKAILKDFRPIVILPIFLMDHSGLAISKDPEFFRACDPQGFDWGMIGFAFVSHEDSKKEFSRKRISKQNKQKAEDILLNEIKAWGQYVSGEVYGYIVKEKDGNEVDSLWGLFGYDYAVKEAKEAVEGVVL